MRNRPAARTAVFLALLVGLLVAAALPSQAAAKGKPCWKQVIDDWVDNGTINGHYSTACLQQALNNIPEDARDYSSLPDQIKAALQDSLRGSGGGGGGTSGDPGSSGDGSGNSEGNNRKLQATPPPSYYRRAIDNLGTTSADSVPIPLLVLAGLGTALLLTAGGLAARKRLKARATPPLGD